MEIRVAILEDKADRFEAMRAGLNAMDAGVAIWLAQSAPEFISAVLPVISSCSIISLDHDLGSAREINGQLCDPGDGRDVAAAIARLAPACPIIIHSTNAMGAQSMRRTLVDAGWAVESVVPYGDLEWVTEAWLPLVRECLGL